MRDYHLCLRVLVMLWLATMGAAHADEPPPAQTTDQAAAVRIEKLQEPLYNPFVERYMLDEVKTLRSELQTLRADLTERFARNNLDVSDRAIQYATSTVNNVFYIIAAAASILALMGWSSLRDIRHRLDEVTEAKVSKITEDYEQRLSVLENKLRDRTERILHAQEEIARTNTLHSLWMRATQENTPQSKIEIYDRILEINAEDAEALTYKADAVLELGEAEWALNLCDKALELNHEYAYAYYQRACAYATLDQLQPALAELDRAIKRTPAYRDEAREDPSLNSLRESGLADTLLQEDAS